MSAEQSRLRSAIQRIAKKDPDLRGAIDAAKSRGDQPGGTGVGESDGERDRICCDGSTSDNANPGTSERDTSGGGQGGLDPSDPAAIDSDGGCLEGVVDCVTGAPLSFCGGDWIPPMGWDEPNPTSPPIDPSYVVGRYYIGPGAYECTNVTATLPADRDDDEWRSGDCTKTSSSCRERAVSLGLCASTTDGDHQVSEELILINGGLWYETGATELAIKGGKIVGSKYDPENDGSYSAPRDEIELCDEDGNSILIRPSSDGGWKSIQSLAGEPDGAVDYGYLYAPDGKRIRQISPSEFRDDMV